MIQEKSSNEVLSEKLNDFFPDENIEIKEEVKEIVEPKKAIVPNPLFEDMEEGEVEEEVEEEAQPEEEKDPKVEEKKELDRRLSGQPKEFKDLVKSVQDKELQTKILDAGKIVRAREDRLSLELGNLKKEYSTTKELIQFIDRDPVAALKHIAKITKTDLGSLIDKPVYEEDDYDYRTPEEKARDRKLEDIERKLNQREQSDLQRQNAEIANQIEEFRNAVDDEGDLKYPLFDKVRTNMALFFNEESPLFNPNITMAKAYQKAILLDDDLVAERDEKLLERAKAKRAAEIEKAKKLKKFTGRSPSAGVKPASSKDALSSIYDTWASGNL
jgi:hypothetical protein